MTRGHRIGRAGGWLLAVGLSAASIAGCYEGIEDHRQIAPGSRADELGGGAWPECTAESARYDLPLVVLSYLPSKDGYWLDADATGVANTTLDEMRGRIAAMTEETIRSLQDGSRYRGYADGSARCSIHYSRIAEREYVEALPPSVPSSEPVSPDYRFVLDREGICHLVDDLGVREVWLWGYHYGNITPAESNMAGPHGDISNSNRSDDMPVCGSTYTLYNYNYGRGVGEAVHNHGHQIESVMSHLDAHTFDEWRYPKAGQGWPTGCGDVHFPPNGVSDYDYANPTPITTDCTDWLPGAAGDKATVSCSDWDCGEDAQRAYLVWWMQNIPGLYNGLGVGNWWEAIADFDHVVVHGFDDGEPDCSIAC